MNADLDMLERWLRGWSLARGLPLPTRDGAGLSVEVGWPEQARRHVFADAGPALQECAGRIDEPFVYLKAAVEPAQMRRALPKRWQMESPRYLMHLASAMPAASATGYVANTTMEHGAHVITLAAADGASAATGRVVLDRGTAVFDRIETFEPYRRRGLASALMCALDSLAQQAAVSERLLVATEAGRALYLRLGWQVVAPYSTVVLAAPLAALPSPPPPPSGK
jgi:GNAT superfamily N-acetyltransferase